MESNFTSCGMWTVTQSVCYTSDLGLWLPVSRMVVRIQTKRVTSRVTKWLAVSSSALGLSCICSHHPLMVPFPLLLHDSELLPTMNCNEIVINHQLWYQKLPTTQLNMSTQVSALRIPNLDSNGLFVCTLYHLPQQLAESERKVRYWVESPLYSVCLVLIFTKYPFMWSPNNIVEETFMIIYIQIT